MRTALIIGGSGQIGRAAAQRLVEDGWRVVLAQRHPIAPPPGCEALELDREQPGALARAAGRGFDALIDTVAFDDVHARQLLQVQADVGALIVISSASVYRDARGRTLDEARETGFPVFPEPITEDHPTVDPGPQTYSTRKVALERVLLDGARGPLSILRPGAIHGGHSTHPREWFFVKRILDGRRRTPLSWSGQSRFHTSATANIAALISAVLAHPATRILHAADPEVLTAAQIGAAIAKAMGAELELVPFEGPPQAGVGVHPWGVASPIVLDMRQAEALGYRPVGGYGDLVGEACRSAEGMARAGAAFAPYLLKMFDYAAEDAWLAAH
ncbi:MAG: NAD(P)H-binding protein [Caulobacteraceae bacterium]|nr:NAD(P)H-binding protein [Caulobacteraceae bacterium]